MKILFICTGNTCRSPMAEGILNHIATEKKINISSKSAGIYAFDGDNVSPNAVKVLSNIGIDIKDKKSMQVHKDLVEEADLILTMSNSHKKQLIMRFPFAVNKVFLLNEYAFKNIKDIEDPYGRGELDYKEACDEIYRAVEKIVNKIRRENK